MKPRIEFIIMKIFMKIVKICPKSPRFTGTLMGHKFIYFCRILQILVYDRSQICPFLPKTGYEVVVTGPI